MKTPSHILALFLFALVPLLAQNDTAGLPSGKTRSADEGIAAEEFRRGVQAYHRGAFNDSAMQFERSLAHKNDDSLILDWLGKAYYRGGMEGEALAAWRRASEQGYGGLALQNRIETVGDRRVTGSTYKNETRFTEAGTFFGERDGALVFSEPVSALPESDGSVWIAAYGSNELLRINVNGEVVDRAEGPLNGFDRPLDIIRLRDGNLLVSESAGDRLSLLKPDGRFIKYIGKKGRGVGECVGPQYLAEDSNGNIFVTDYGNSRVDVFDKDGEGLFFFGGKKQSGFDGLRGPTGIAIAGGRVFVADDVIGAVREFDMAGNYSRDLALPGTFAHPESMKVWQNYLVICDSNKVISIDMDTGATIENARAGNAPSRLTCAVPDANGNVIVTDMRANEVYVMARMKEIVGGLFVQIDRIDSRNFPSVTIDVKVEDRSRRPIVGLRESNFYLSEGKNPVAAQKFIGAASSNSVVDVTVIIDRSIQSAAFEDAAQSALREIAASMNGEGTLRIVSAGAVPVTEYQSRPAAFAQFTVKSLKTPPSQVVPLDLAFRLACNDLVNAQKKRAVIFLTAGSVTQGAFSRYTLAQVASYMNNNSIALSFVLLSQNALCEELSYLSGSVEGEKYYVFRPEGLSSIVSDLLGVPNGLYQLSYQSNLPTNMGESYLRVEAEASVMNRSGRDESGYFAPLQ